MPPVLLAFGSPDQDWVSRLISEIHFVAEDLTTRHSKIQDYVHSVLDVRTDDIWEAGPLEDRSVKNHP